MGFDGNGIDAKQDGASCGLIVHGLAHLLKARAGKQISDFGKKVLLEGLLDEFGHGLGGAFGGFEQDVSAISVGDDDVGIPGEGFPGFDVAKEIDFLAFLSFFS